MLFNLHRNPEDSYRRVLELVCMLFYLSSEFISSGSISDGTLAPACERFRILLNSPDQQIVNFVGQFVDIFFHELRSSPIPYLRMEVILERIAVIMTALSSWQEIAELYQEFIPRIEYILREIRQRVPQEHQQERVIV
jgi:hypothetical protein